MAAGHRPSISAKVPPAVASLIDACWAGNPDLRPGMEAVVKALKVKATMMSRQKYERLDL